MKMTNDFKYYIYEHYLDNKLFYIGKGSGGRAFDLLSRSHLWKTKVLGRESEVEIKIIAGFHDNGHAESFEKLHIHNTSESKMGYRLTNITHNKLNSTGIADGSIILMARLTQKYESLVHLLQSKVYSTRKLLL